MRNSTLEKAFLAYEMVHYSDLAKSHFTHPRITEAFNPSGIENLKAVILNPLIQLYKNPPQIEANEIIEQKAGAVKTIKQSTPEEKLQNLTTLCLNYLKHLDNPDGSKGKAKHTLATQMLLALSKPNEDAPTRIDKMEKLLTAENKNLLKDHRSGTTFLENVLHVLSLGFYSKATKGTFAFWKSHGEVLTDNIEKEIKNKP